jgi:hypothetical protein
MYAAIFMFVSLSAWLLSSVVIAWRQEYRECQKQHAIESIMSGFISEQKKERKTRKLKTK